MCLMESKYVSLSHVFKPLLLAPLAVALDLLPPTGIGCPQFSNFLIG